MERSKIETVVDAWERLAIFSTQPRELVDAQRSGRLAHDPPRLAALLRSAGQGAVAPAWGRLATLDLPALAIAGELDPGYVAAAERMAALLARGRARTVPGAGHAAHLERPEAVARLALKLLDDDLGQRGLTH